jgi:hypothetical protein
MAIEQQPPDVLAMVLADAALRDVATGKYTLQGCFSQLHAEEFPHRQSSIIVYAAITSGHGRTPIKLCLVDANEEHEPLFETETVIQFPDPLTVIELVFALGNVEFPERGEYRMQLFGAGQPLRERRIYLGRIDEPPAP